MAEKGRAFPENVKDYKYLGNEWLPIEAETDENGITTVKVDPYNRAEYVFLDDYETGREGLYMSPGGEKLILVERGCI